MKTFNPDPFGADKDFFAMAAELMRLTLVEEASRLWAKGEQYPVAFVVDGCSLAARRLKELLPAPADADPHNPGLFGTFPHTLARRCLQEVLECGHLLDHPRDAPAGRSFWRVMVIENRATVDLVTLEDGEEDITRRVEFRIRT